MNKFNYKLNDMAFYTLVVKCLYGEPTDEDVRECENQIKLLQQENKQLKDRINKASDLLKLLHYQFPDYDDIHNRIEDIENILKEDNKEKVDE